MNCYMWRDEAANMHISATLLQKYLKMPKII
jgi:hypothetical protein